MRLKVTSRRHENKCANGLERECSGKFKWLCAKNWPSTCYIEGGFSFGRKIHEYTGDSGEEIRCAPEVC